VSTAIQAQWQTLKRGRPGRRFRDRYEASRRGASRRTWVQRVLRMTLAAAAIAIGVVLVFVPGPAVLFFAVAGALLASESRGVARFMDRCEVTMRNAWNRVRGRG
jgi:hypothetical protein